MKRSAPEEFNISFLDVICCGFGAVILLLLITIKVAPQLIEKSATSLQSQKRELLKLGYDPQAAQAKKDEMENTDNDWTSKIQKIKQELQELRDDNEASMKDLKKLAAENKIQTGRKRSRADQNPIDNFVLGIPTDSEYVIFIIDTSNSVRNSAWRTISRTVNQALEIYPDIKGIQILSNNGTYFFDEKQDGEWENDLEKVKAQFKDRIESWSPVGSSNPNRAISIALNHFAKREKKISIYLFGDDVFGGVDIDHTIKIVRIREKEIQQPIRIHTFAFPENPSVDKPREYTVFMRELAFRLGGSFVGLNRDHSE